MDDFRNSNHASVSILRWIGYGLLIFALIDAIVILYPPSFMNPAWELQTIGALVERAPVPLIGFGLIFLGDPSRWRLPERILLIGLSWLSLIIAAAFLFMVPLGIVDTIRLNRQANEQVTTQVEQRLTQLDQIQQAINRASPQNLEQLATRFEGLEESVNIEDPQAIRGEISSRVDRAKVQLRRQAETSQSQRRSSLLKNSVKWNLGALITCALFGLIFKYTSWVRSFKGSQVKEEY